MAEEKEGVEKEDVVAAPEKATKETEKKEETPVPEKSEKDRVVAEALSAEVVAEKSDAPKVRRMKGAKNVLNGIVHITATFNNTVVSVTDTRGNVISWSSAGRAGFKGSRKSTAFAASSVSAEAAKAAMNHGLQEVEVRVQGPGAGRESAIRAVQSAGLRVTTIKDVTPIPHNGCRPKKRRRV